MVSKGNKVVVVGAGLMGTGIAHAFASSGFVIDLVDTSETALEKASFDKLRAFSKWCHTFG